MGAAQTISLLLAGGAALTGVMVVGVMWRRHRRRARARRGRHPSTLPPITVSFDVRGDGTHLRIDVRSGAPRTAIDIVSFRPSAPGAEWEAEPIVAPIVIDPGGFALMPTPVDGETRYDVVVAWTTDHPAGAIQGSRGFEVPSPRQEWAHLALPSRPQLSGPVAATLATLFASVVALVVLSANGVLDRNEVDDFTLPSTTELRLTTAPTAPPSSPSVATTTTSTTAPRADDDGGDTTTTEPGTSTSTTSTSTTVAPSTVAPSTGTTLDGTGPTVAITGRTGACRFGPNCLIASFTIDGFDPEPGEYVCEFEDGGRFSFTFVGIGVADACATGTADAEITIEVAGVRSPTLSRSDV